MSSGSTASAPEEMPLAQRLLRRRGKPLTVSGKNETIFDKKLPESSHRKKPFPARD